MTEPLHLRRLSAVLAGLTLLVVSALAASASAAGQTARTSQVFCSTPIQDFVNQVQHVQAEADISTLKQYDGLVKEASAAQARVPWSKTKGVCLTGVGDPAKDALKLYKAVATEWAACTTKGTCTSSAAKTYRTHTWAAASRKIQSAYNRLD